MAFPRLTTITYPVTEPGDTPIERAAQCLRRMLCSRFSALTRLCQPVGQEGSWGEHKP